MIDRKMRIKFLGKSPLCNGRPERAPHIGSFCFPLCWRCTGAVIGVLFSIIIIEVFQITLNLTCTLLVQVLIIPSFLDYFQVKLFDGRGTNIRRLLTGILLGGAVEVFILFISI